MNFEKYTVERDNIKNILGYIESGDIAIPELQRPFVWKQYQITELIESLYRGLPTGFIVVWTSDTAKLKDGTKSIGKKIIIDGQQRITALRSVLLGKEVITQDFSVKIFKVAYNPYTEEFESQIPIHLKSSKWIPDISIFFDSSFSDFDFISNFVKKNPDMDTNELAKKISKVKAIVNREIGKINLSSRLDIAEATNIFNLMNTKGTRLGQEDFIMAKLSSNTDDEGSNLWQTIDYLCKGLIDKRYLKEIPQKDKDFFESEYYNQLKWLLKFDKTIYKPTYNDVLRVSYSYAFKSGILRRLTELLSGRNFETKKIEPAIAKESYKKLKMGIFSFINEHNFKTFNLYIESTGVKYDKLINSQSALNSAYIIYLLLKDDANIKNADIKTYVQKWYIMSILTKRYSASSETRIDQDIKNIQEKGFLNYFNEIESSILNSEFWKIQLVQDLETSSSNSPAYLIYLAAQINNKAYALFSKKMFVEDLIKIKGDTHHIFPANYLKENNIFAIKKINQVANYAFIDTTINIDISDDAPDKYFPIILNNYKKEEFEENLKQNCIPQNIIKYNYRHYDKFLKERRILIANYIKDYYESL
ncbi:MAG: DUF262 domain-containing protein [Firmicutes bacterium]|nr:DUF262 domain-containing protein [Bacillota bacterium]